MHLKDCLVFFMKNKTFSIGFDNFMFLIKKAINQFELEKYLKIISTAC